MKLAEIAKRLGNVEVKGELVDKHVKGVTHDSRKVKEGYMFACVPGFSTDGHLYIEDAKKRGAVAALVERFCECDIPQIKVDSVRKSLPWVASWVYGEPSRGLLCIGVTGTNGKTTTTFLIKSILEKAGYKPMLFGTIEYRFGDRVIPASRTTPEASDIMEFISEGVNSGNDSLVMEVSSHSLDLHRVDSIDFDIGILTNITPEHLDFHGTFENYRNSKAKLFKKTKKSSVLNADDESYSFIKDVAASPVISYGVKSFLSDVRLKKVDFKFGGMDIEIETPIGVLYISSSLMGMFNVYNILASVACGISLGLDLTVIKEGIEAVKGVPGRMEVFKKEGFPTVVIDYAHTPDALEKVLLAIEGFNPKRIISVFGLGGNRFVDNRPIMGKIAASMCYKVFITSDNARWENPMDIAKQIAEGCKLVGGKYEIVLNRKRAIEKAIEEASPGDVVLVAGKGHEDYFEIKGQIRYFSDREVVEKILGLRG
ncbi:MAG: UDP-N-acetylmuramoyl-L-alanyl-D-glutamate--2,6-diaminopimelate ligase [Synergistetes bacterium]|nr:UDP-N-acetylmuramoyl-L-alanyl-D-glutamate--2,6-diaminopimelate ligase [Synergistota bacterium]MCX8127787.1 UDP-N-acetylmuramoyl-L-alanyl-D-glutamate--2,6-diaminopimelate ligase [Synergistota bacterium]MDW8192049.1 UDP-N-acetylmuramoyl-L-alanyl-D-glutamate--2,6-diaminopimelate ligase [Synergistota bacterium]